MKEPKHSRETEVNPRSKSKTRLKSRTSANKHELHTNLTHSNLLTNTVNLNDINGGKECVNNEINSLRV